MCANFLKTLLGIQGMVIERVGRVGTSVGSYLIIDQINIRLLDNRETLTMLTGVNHCNATQIPNATHQSMMTNDLQSVTFVPDIC